MMASLNTMSGPSILAERTGEAGSMSQGKSSLQQKMVEETCKIQRWQISTQMDLDAKMTQLRQQELLLEKQAENLRHEYKRAEDLQQKLEDKEKESARTEKKFQEQMAINKALETGIQVRNV